MKTLALAGLLFAAAQLADAPAADACGVKLTIKTTSPKKMVAHSSNPSHVLLLGSHTVRLQRELTGAGHDVEVAPSASTAKRKQYAVVVADDSKAEEARTNFPDAVVIIDNGDEGADMRQVEVAVARTPGITSNRQPLQARESRVPLRRGPDQSENKGPLNAKTGDQVAVADVKPVKSDKPEVKAPDKQPDKQPDKIEKQPDKQPETPAKTDIESKPDKTPHVATVEKAAPPEVAVKPSKFPNAEVFFGFGSYGLTAPVKKQLDKTTKWLNDNSSAHATIEGYADPTGSHDANMTLSQSRAEAVRDYLVNAGVDTSRLEVTSYGDTKLKYGHGDGRNRRAIVVPK